MENSAQRLYIGTSIGYGFRAGSTVAGYNNNADGSAELVKSSSGAGITPHFSIGYLFSKNIGAEINLGYLIGNKTSLTNTPAASPYTLYTTTSNSRTNSFYIVPSFIIRANGNKLVPFAKFGLFIGILNNATTKVSYSNNNSVISDKTQFIQKGNFATGFTSAFGLDLMLSDKFVFFGELTGRLASWAPDSYTMNTSNPYLFYPAISATQSGHYVNTLPPNYAGTNRLTQIISLSAIGFNVGIKFYFGK